MRSDVPVAFCMSGGVDSNSLISIASKIASLGRPFSLETASATSSISFCMFYLCYF
ncbi:asparagine synthase-related protein [uncultured Dokdonia sp.]|uniref:asparagine synthase-related protein n=1 Tax=uncultured Dokdonia sp. TaxID=575653 RepID=UPI00344B82FF